MSVRQANGGRRWLGRATLALVPLLVIGTTVRHVVQERAEERGKLEQELQRLRERTKARWETFAEGFRADSLPTTNRSIDEAIDQAFAPVYDGIDPFLDWHYSFWGQSTQLVLYLLEQVEDLTGTQLGGLEGEVASRLLGGLEDRLGNARERVDSAMTEEIRSKLDAWFVQEEALLPVGRTGTEYGRILKRVREDTTRRFSVSVGPSVIGGGMANVATSVGVRAASNRLAARLPLVVRRSVLSWIDVVRPGPTIPVAVIIDVVIRRIDEWLNREDLHQELIEMVNAERERARSEFFRAADSFKLDSINTLGSFVPAELVRRSPAVVPLPR